MWCFINWVKEKKCQLRGDEAYVERKKAYVLSRKRPKWPMVPELLQS